MALEGTQKKFDIFSLVILLLVLALIIGGQVLTFSALESKIEELQGSLDVPTAVIDSKIEHLREEIRMMKRAASGSAHAPSPGAPAPGAPASAAPAPASGAPTGG